MKKYLKFFCIYFFSLIFVIIIRSISFFFLIRFININSHRIGHFATNIELYFCELEKKIIKPNKFFLDIAFCDDAFPTCNNYLLKLWKREIIFWPASLCYAIIRINKFLDTIIVGSSKHVISSSKSDRDIFNLLDMTNPKIKLKKEEIADGDKFILEKFGINKKDKIVCLTARDNKYLKETNKSIDYSYHDYRDTDINRFNKSIKTLIDLGYFVFRMGVSVNKPVMIEHSNVIDYAYNGMRTDFLDVYLAQRCSFCISTSTGFDALPLIFRKHIGYITVPIGLVYTFSEKFVSITKHHYSLDKKRNLNLREIFQNNLGFAKKSSDFSDKNITLNENSEEEINDLVIEIHERYTNKYNEKKTNLELQNIFWNNFENNIKKDFVFKNHHGKFKGRMNYSFLNNNRNFFQ